MCFFARRNVVGLFGGFRGCRGRVGVFGFPRLGGGMAEREWKTAMPEKAVIGDE